MFLNLIGIIAVLFGLGVFLYPIVANYLVSQQSVELTQHFNKARDRLPEQEINHQLTQAKEYNTYIYDMSKGIPYPKLKPNYNKILKVDDSNMMGSINIPQINASNIPIYHGDDVETLELGVGHIEQTSLPVGGESTHTVLSAHSGRANNTLFSNLDKLKKGDVFYLSVLNLKLKYKITDIRVVEPDDASSLSIKDKQDLATLVTCYPTGVNTHRLLVTGEAIPYTEKTKQEEIKRDKFGYDFWVMLGSGLLALVALILILMFILRKRKENKKEKEKER